MSDVYGGSVVEQIDGESIEFAKLNNKQIESIENLVKGKMRSQAQIDAEGLPPAERAMFVRQAVPVFVQPELLDTFIATSEGARTVLDLALKNANLGDEKRVEVLNKLGSNTLRASEVARDVLGFLAGERIARRLLAALKRIEELEAAAAEPKGNAGSKAA